MDLLRQSFGVLPLAAAMCFASLDAVAQSTDATFVNANVVDVELGTILANQAIVVRNGRIASVMPMKGARVAGANRVDLHGMYVIPGLWDMHVHIGIRKDGDVPTLTSYYGGSFLRSGVTAVRDAGGNMRRLASIDSAGRARPGTFPRMIHAGEKLGPGESQKASGPFGLAEAKAGITQRRSNGAHYIKLNGAYPDDVFRETLAECASTGLKCVAHIPAADTALWLTAPGRGSYEHLFNIAPHVAKVPASELFVASEEYYQPTLFQRVLYKLRLRKRPVEPFVAEVQARDTGKDDKFFQRLAGSGTWFTPTLVLHHRMTRAIDLPAAGYDSALSLSLPPNEERTPQQLQAAQDLWRMWSGEVLAMWRARVNMLAGTDFSGVHAPGGSLQAELVLLQQAGIPAADVLRMATLNPARYLAATDSMGSVNAGKVADLVVLRRNPLEDMARVGEIEMVMTRGVLLRRDALDRLTSDARAAARRMEP